MELLSRWLDRRRQRARDREFVRQSRVALVELFRDPGRLAPTSLRPEHHARIQRKGYEEEEGTLVAVSFLLLRHPRPHPFSMQFHEVLELWRLPMDGSPPDRVEAVNLTRDKGSDGEPTGRAGPGI